MNASPKQPLAKGWDDILDIPARWDGEGRAARTLRRRRKQPLAKGRPSSHTTTPEKRPLRRAPTAPKGTT
jgi:hypothetical protein